MAEFANIKKEECIKKALPNDILELFAELNSLKETRLNQMFQTRLDILSRE